MKQSFLIVLVILVSLNSFCGDITHCKDSIVKSYNHVECIENVDTLYQWTAPFDSISIKLVNRWGKIVRETSNPYISISELFNSKSTNTLPIGTYVFMLTAYLQGEKKCLVYYFNLKEDSCACG